MKKISHYFSRSTFRTWPILIAFVVIILLSVGVHVYMVNTDSIDYSCRANAYFEDPNDGITLTLHMKSKDQVFTIDSQLYHQGKILGDTSLKGHLDDLDLVSMTYKLHTDEEDVNFTSQIQPIAVSEAFTKEAFGSSNTTKFDVHVLDMDTDKGYAIIQFIPGNNIWLCNSN